MSVPHLRILRLGGILIRVASGTFRRRGFIFRRKY